MCVCFLWGGEWHDGHSINTVWFLKQTLLFKKTLITFESTVRNTRRTRGLQENPFRWSLTGVDPEVIVYLSNT